MLFMTGTKTSLLTIILMKVLSFAKNIRTPNNVWHIIQEFMYIAPCYYSVQFVFGVRGQVAIPAKIFA
jgi:hypothetical protein